MTIKPLFDKVVLKKPEKKETTKSGLILAAAQETPDFMEVIAVGDGAVVDGEKQPMLVKVGDKVLVAKFAGTHVEMDKKEYTIVSQQEILAIVE
ncbi:MAG: co-chaperone GroES [Oscillospiraceae bacterium]|nr:co-chaperone GroES [Oscillospiraceae bacterium]